MSDAIRDHLRDQLAKVTKVAYMSDHQLFLAIKAETAEWCSDCAAYEGHGDDGPAKPAYLRLLEQAAIHRLDPSG